MAVTPEGSLSLVCEHVRDMLAASDTFRSLPATKLLTHAAAKARIHWEDLPPPANHQKYTKSELESYRPFAVVELFKENGYGRQRAAVGAWEESGVVLLGLERTCSDVTSKHIPTLDAQHEWANLVGKIIGELCALADEADPVRQYLQFSSIEVQDGPYHSDADRAVGEGVSQGVILTLTF